MKQTAPVSFMSKGLNALVIFLSLVAFASIPSATPPTTPLYAANSVSCFVAPIGIPQDAFENPELGIAKGDAVYSTSVYKNKPMRRFFLRDVSDATTETPPADAIRGQFAWFRWNVNDQNPPQSLAAALLPPGTIDQFEEAPRPPEFPNEPAVYPDHPGILDASDVVYGETTLLLGNGYGTGTSFDGASSTGELTVTERLKKLVDDHTYLTLPKYDLATNAIRSTARFRIQGFGGYLLAGYGFIDRNNAWLKDSSGGQDVSRGYGWFVDLVQIDTKSKCVIDPFTTVTLTGTSQIKPVFKEHSAPEQVTLKGSIKLKPAGSTITSTVVPVDLVVVLDGSNSMNWTSDGLGTLSAQSAPDLLPFLPAGTQIGDSIDCIALLSKPKGCTPADAYQDYTQRRIYIAKRGITMFLERSQWKSSDRVAVVTFNGGWQNPASGDDPDQLVKIYPPEGFTTSILSGTNNLRYLFLNEAATANPGNSDPDALYRTTGGSPGALGLLRVKQLLDTQARPDAEHDVILMTDGLFNVDLQGKQSADLSIRANYDPSRARNLPINQAIDQADLLKDVGNSLNARMYVLALGNTFLQSGLDYIPSTKAPPYFDTASSPVAITGLLSHIGTHVIMGECEPYMLEPQVPPADTMFRFQDGNYVSTIGTQGQPTLGTVTVRDAENQLVTRVDIEEDGSFTIPHLLPKTTYRLSFNRHEDDPVFFRGNDGVFREYSIVAATGSDSLEWRTTSTSIGTTQYVLDGQPVLLLLDGNLCPTSEVPAPLAAQVIAAQAIASTPVSTPSYSKSGENDECDLIEQGTKVPEWERSAQTGASEPPLIDGEKVIGTVIARDIAGTVVTTSSISLNGSWSLWGLQPGTDYVLSFNTAYTDIASDTVIQPILYRGDDGVYRSYSVIESTGTEQLVIHTREYPGFQALDAPVILRHVADCPAIPTETPPPTAIKPTDDTPVPPTATPTATATGTPPGSSASEWRVYLMTVRH